jgi:hypothetical protein
MHATSNRLARHEMHHSHLIQVSLNFFLMSRMFVQSSCVSKASLPTWTSRTAHSGVAFALGLSRFRTP